MSNNNTTTDVNHHTPSCNLFLFQKMPWFHRKSFCVYNSLLKKAGDFQVDKNLTQKPSYQTQKTKASPPAIKTLQPTKTTSSPPQKKNLFVSPAKSGVLDNNSLSSFRVERKARGPTGHKLDIPLKPGDPAEPSTVGSWLSPKKNAPDSACRFGKFEENKIYIYIYGLGMAPSQQQ